MTELIAPHDRLNYLAVGHMSGSTGAHCSMGDVFKGWAEARVYMPVRGT